MKIYLAFPIMLPHPVYVAVFADLDVPLVTYIFRYVHTCIHTYIYIHT